METTLFWIGCGLGGYAFVLRQIFKSENLLNRRALTAFLHILFLSGVGALIGFVFSASMDLQGPTPQLPIIGSAIGLIWAVVQVFRGRSGAEPVSELLAGDLEWVETSFSAILLAAVIMYCVLQAFKIPSGSMEDTLLIKDHLFVNKFIYGIRIPYTDKRILKLRDVKRGDVVVFEAPESAILAPDERRNHVHKDFIKRAIGLPGDQIEVKSKHVYVNGKATDEPYAVFKDVYTWPAALKMDKAAYQEAWESGELALHRREEIGDNFGPITVPANCYFVMGDNRDQSFDGRFWGPLPNHLLKGKAWIVYWPFSRMKIIR